MVKVRDKYGLAFSGNIGAGQGDVMSVLSALVITTIQFRLISHRHPLVSLSSVVDDRTFRGPYLEVTEAVNTALAFVTWSS